MNFSSFACFNGPLSWNTLYNACCVKTVPDKKKMLLKHFEKEEYIGTSIFSFFYNVFNLSGFKLECLSLIYTVIYKIKAVNFGLHKNFCLVNPFPNKP